MPLFALHALDRPGALTMRLEHYAAHRAFLEEAPVHQIEIVMSGPLQSEDGELVVGSLFILEAPDRQAVEGFAKADPFAVSGVWGDLHITRFSRRI